MLKHFSQGSKYGLKVYELSEKEIPQFMSILPSLFLDCYASEEKINIGTINGIARKEVIGSYIPDKGNIKSGDFGEILSFYMMKDEYKQYEPDAPLKWRYKIDKNTAAPKTDVILICKDMQNDFIVAAECKAKATNTKKNPILDAIEGMRDDALSRVVKTLVWLKDKATQAGDKEGLDRLTKLLNPVGKGTYDKHFKAIAIIDKDLFTEQLHTEADIEDIDFNYELIAIVIPNLKDKYETIFQKVLEC